MPGRLPLVRGRAWVAADGSFRLTGLLYGDVALTVGAAGYARTTETVTAGEQHVRIRLQ